MKISTTGYLIIEGNRAEFANLKMQKGTLIRNALSVSQGSEFSGGTVIINVLSERAATGNTSEDNADGYPFGRSVSGSTGTFNFTFSGSKVYLFGHYSTTANGSYDSKLDQTATALTDGNPVKPMVERYRSGGVYTDTDLPCPELLRRSGLRTGSTCTGTAIRLPLRRMGSPPNTARLPETGAIPLTRPEAFPIRETSGCQRKAQRRSEVTLLEQQIRQMKRLLHLQKAPLPPI